MSHSSLTQNDVSIPTSTPSQRSSSIRDRLAHAVPTVAVLAALCGLAAWGHSTDWTMPTFLALIGSSRTAAEDWCKEHNVPESQCIECKPSLVPRSDHGWCKEHGVANCPLHHPDIAQLADMASVTAADFDRAQRALALLPRQENNSRCELHTRRIQFESVEVVEKAGIDIAVVQERPVLEAITANCEVIYDQTNVAHLSSRASGTVWRVIRQIGDSVRAGEVLAFVDAAEVGRNKNEFLQAISQLRLKQTVVDRMRPLVNGGSISERTFLEAEAALQEARIRVQTAQQALVNLGLSVRAGDFADVATDKIAERIQFLGIPRDSAKEWDKEATSSNLLPLRSPLDGMVVERKVVAGEVVDTVTKLFTIADVTRLWLMLDVRQEDARYVSLGQPVLFKPNGKNQSEIKGTVSWLSTSAEAQTRTVKVRVDLPNAEGRLRANTFGTGRIVLREEPKAITVPTEAVHWDGCCHVVFVRDKDFLNPDAPKFFHVRKVRTGVKAGDTTEIIIGLLPGEVIASKNSVVLEAQLLKSNLGEGCACCAPAKK